MVYKVIGNGTQVGTYKTEKDAMKVVKLIEQEGETVSVFAVETSGTYRSQMQIYPKRCQAYSN
jgi:hypothetical protein